MPIKLTSEQYRVIAVAVLVAALSLGVTLKYFGHAFPEAAIDFRVNRDDSAPLAKGFLAQRGIRVDGYRHAAVFGYSDEAKLYLERTQGLGRMNRLTRGPIRLWRWSHRWFKPQQKEEFRVDVSPAGEVVGFDHEIPEAAAGANLDQPAARQVAEHFLREVMKRDLADLEFVEAASNKRPARTDHSFVWKQKSVDLGDGSLRVEVEVDGNQVGGYREFVKIPEQWSRDYERIRSRNETAQTVDQVFWVLLSVAMLVILVMRVRDRDVPVRLSFGFGLVGAVLFFLGRLNTFTLADFSYSTTDPYSSFVANYVVGSVLSALGIGTLILLLVASSEPVYREGLPQLLSLGRALSWQGLRSRSFFMANVVGLCLTFFFFAYQTVFYLTANHLGAWAPTDVPFSDELNTRIPWVGVLFMGFLPAVSEEMQFRAFAIPFLKRITRSWPLALALAAFNWGFLHALYPNQPFFIRGVEVGLGGIVTGLVMLRFGIVATLVWHYSVDALYTAFLLLRSPNHYLMVSGVLTAGIMLVPLIMALVAYWRTGTFTDEAPLTNASEGVSRAPHAEPPAEPKAAVSYEPLSKRRLILAGVLTLACAALSMIPIYRFGEGVKVRATRSDALRVAEDFLKQRRVPVQSYHRVASLRENVDPLALRYLLERRPVDQADHIYRQATRLLLWEVRFFRPLEKEEHHVYVDATTGGVFGYRRIVDEDAAGASLSPQAARTLAENSVQQQGYKLPDFELQDSRGEKRKTRVDYTFVWQARPGDPRNVGDAHYRLEVDIAGDQVAGFSRYFKLPEDWVRQRESTRLANVVLTVIKYVLIMGLVGAGLIVFIRQVRDGRIPWRGTVTIGAVFATAMLLLSLNPLSSFEQRYPTSIPLSTFWLWVAVGFPVVALLAGLGGWVLVAFAISLYPDAWRIFRGAARRAWRADAFAAVAVSLSVAAALAHVSAALSNHFHTFAQVGIQLAPDSADTFLPGGGVFLYALMAGVGRVAALGLLIYLLLQAWARRPWWIWPAGVLFLAALGPAGAHSLREFFLGWSLDALSLAAGVAILAAFFRNNVLAYISAAFCLLLTEPAASLLSEPLPFFRGNGALLAALSLMVLGWMFLPKSSSQ